MDAGRERFERELGARRRMPRNLTRKHRSGSKREARRTPQHSTRSADLAERLDALVSSTDRLARRESDPVGFVHRYSSVDDREIVGLIAALLAFGGVGVIRAKVADLLSRMGSSPAAFIDAHRRPELDSAFAGFRHRVWSGGDLAALLANAATIRADYGSLGRCLAVELGALDKSGEHESASAFIEALARFSDALRGSNPGRGLKHLVADPRSGSACKRTLLYLRWMVRPSDGIDLGIWQEISPSRLIIPVDTHVFRIARNLGLTERSDASLKTANEITNRLRGLDPEDPVRYDFAICHLGISRSCPSKRDDRACASCVMQPVCIHWREP